MKDLSGFFGPFGGAYISAELNQEMQKVKQAYIELKNNPQFVEDMQYIRRTYQGRPTPITYAKNLTTANPF